MLYYHVYNRGTDKRTIFQDAQDFERFLDGLVLFSNKNFKGNLSDIPINVRRAGGRTSRDCLVEVHAYCLNPNHYHLIISCRDPKDLSKFIQRLGTGYTMYFNEKYERTGVLFQGKYKKVLVESESQLLHLLGYVNLNYYLHEISTPSYRSSIKEYFSPKYHVLTNVDIVISRFNSFKSLSAFCVKQARYSKDIKNKQAKRIKQYID